MQPPMKTSKTLFFLLGALLAALPLLRAVLDMLLELMG